MPVSTKIELDGIRDIGRFCKELPKRSAKKALRSAVTAGTTPIAKAVRKLAPRRTDTLKKSITKKIKGYPSGNYIGIVGANKDTVGQDQYGRKVVPAKYIHLVTYGTQSHNQPKRGVIHPGAKATNFIRDGFEQVKGMVNALMENKMYQVVMQEMKKLLGK